jgi:hypothetical protein
MEPLHLAHGCPILALAAVAYTAEHAGTNPSPPPDMFYTDTTEIRIDNHATTCMLDNIADFIGPLVTTNRVVKGFAGHRMANIQRGTIEW